MWPQAVVPTLILAQLSPQCGQVAPNNILCDCITTNKESNKEHSSYTSIPAAHIAYASTVYYVEVNLIVQSMIVEV